jgi:two-component system sensor histidine kinase QseC
VLHARAQDLYVQVAQPLQERTELLEDMAENLVWPALALLVLLAALNWWVIRRQLRPLERLAEDIGRQSPQALNAVSAAGQADPTGRGAHRDGAAAQRIQLGRRRVARREGHR